MQYLDSLSEVELLALREQVAPSTAPAYGAPPAYVEAVLTDEQRGIYPDRQGKVELKPTHQEKKSKRTPEETEADVYRNCGVTL